MRFKGALTISESSIGSEVGIAKRYELEGSWIETRWEAKLSAPVLGPTQFLVRVRASFQGVRRPARDTDHPSPSRAEVIERVELRAICLIPVWAFMISSRMNFIPFLCMRSEEN